MGNTTDNKIWTLDSTLRDGVQGEGISFSVQDKIHICQALDALGVTYIEAGNPGSNPKDMEFFAKMREVKLATSKLCAFGSTRRKDIKCPEDTALQSLIGAGTDDVVIFGKSWLFQVTDILKTTPSENLAMIRDTVAYLSAQGKRVIFDAEHFFTGFADNSEYALKTLTAAVDGGAHTLCLCETKGGCLLDDCRSIVKKVCAEFAGRATVGIHTHNDMGLAVANTLLAVSEGVRHVQGVFLGFGERTGNANLATIIADLQLKMGYECIDSASMKLLTPTAKKISEIANISLPSGLPYVGSGAFSHKAGMHIDAVLKNPFAYEHIDPAVVGNERVFLMSEVAGRATIIEKLQNIDKTIDKSSPVVSQIIAKVKSMEASGYQFDGADGSFELLARKMLGRYKPFFKLHYYTTSGTNPRIENGVCANALVKLEVDSLIEVTAGEGDGPVNALDIAMRKALGRFYPSLLLMKLTDYKVRVLSGSAGTDSRVRVLIESTDGNVTWATCGVSSDVIEASYIALCDSFEYKLIKDMERHLFA